MMVSLDNLWFDDDDISYEVIFFRFSNVVADSEEGGMKVVEPFDASFSFVVADLILDLDSFLTVGCSFSAGTVEGTHQKYQR